MALRPNNVPSTVGVPGGAPNSLLAVATYLTQLVAGLNNWVAGAANAINYTLTTPASNSLLTSAAPTGTTSTTSVMVGLGLTLTPAVSGKVVAGFSVSANNATAGDGLSLSLRYGTGTPPSNGSAVAGTRVSAALSFISVAASDGAPFSASVLVPGLTVGTSYWFDLDMLVVTGGTLVFSSKASIWAAEIR